MMNSIEQPGDYELRISLSSIACFATSNFNFSATFYDDNIFERFALTLIDARVYVASIRSKRSKTLVGKCLIFLLVDLKT